MASSSRFGWSGALILACIAACCRAIDVSQCSCGYVDEASGLRYTESIIAYFNESGIDGQDYTAQSYTHQSEKSWNALYRSGASANNVISYSDSNSKYIKLLVDPPTSRHVVVGGGINTLRRDILHGTFRAFVRSPPASRAGGSVLTMSVQYNDANTIDINMMNTNDPSTAWMNTIMREEHSSSALGITYRDILAAAKNNASVHSPWDFIELRIDWQGDQISYFVDGNLTRRVRNNSDLPQTPRFFNLRHWSTGDRDVSQGPPANQTHADLGWTRLFFNSSLMSLQQHQEFDDRCQEVDPCSIDDWTLRNSSPYDRRALLPFKVVDPKAPRQIPAIVVSAASVGIMILLLMHTCMRRQPWKKRIEQTSSRDSQQIASTLVLSSQDQPVDVTDFAKPADLADPAPNHTYNVRDSQSIHPITPASGSTYGLTLTNPNVNSSALSLSNARFSRTHTLVARSRIGDTESEDMILPAFLAADVSIVEDHKPPKKDRLLSQDIQPAAYETILEPIPPKQPEPLDSLLLLCSIVITTVDFALTFNLALIQPSALPHYVSEIWARRTVTPFFLSFIWIGPLITISSQYLTMGYLRHGHLEDIARKAVTQIPRLMIPVIIVTLIEYFLINTGVTRSLIHLPSLSWSAWPYTSTFDNFGNWITELIELAFLMPNAAPAVTFHYCTGVLWLIPVLLQFSFTMLLGVVVLREIKRLWKRMLYSIFTIMMHWYARSWGSFLWLGLLFADLDITYDWKTRLSAQRWLATGILFIFIILVLLGGMADLVTEWTGYNFSWAENNIHPDSSTALPLSATKSSNYPPYYIPRLSGLAFAVGLHGIVEISKPVQALLTIKFFARLAPHAWTIYLIHGLIFWSWGAWLAVVLAGNIGLPYWSVSLVVGLTSYTLLALTLPLLTPVLVVLEKNMRKLMWHTAVTEPPHKRNTIYPFDQDLIRSYEESNATSKA